MASITSTKATGHEDVINKLERKLEESYNDMEDVKYNNKDEITISLWNQLKKETAFNEIRHNNIMDDITDPWDSSSSSDCSVTNNDFSSDNNISSPLSD